MNSKGIRPIDDKSICMMCLKKKATNAYYLRKRGYGSIFDSVDTKFQVCNECNRPEYDKWFNESCTLDENMVEHYQFEDEIHDMILALPVESQELFENSFDLNNRYLNPQDWIDYFLGEMSHEKCREKNLRSPLDMKMYRERFPVCQNVVNVVFEDGSACSKCMHSVFGEYNQKIDELNCSSKCTECKNYKKRKTPIKTINGKSFDAWRKYMLSQSNFAEEDSNWYINEK